MITPELPPLPNPPLEYRHEGCTYIDRESFLEWHDKHSARERILLARVAELERLWRSVEACYAEADAAAMSHAKRIAELEAELMAAADVLDNCRYSELPAAKRARDAARGAK
ncbi:MAG: hypothetical protein ACK5PF_08860 [bacterium]